MTVAELTEEEISTTAKEEAKSSPVPFAVPPNHADLNAAIGLRAYALWEASGRVPGQELDFWLIAENELFGSGDGPTA